MALVVKAFGSAHEALLNATPGELSCPGRAQASSAADTPPPGPAAPVPASSDLPAPQTQETRRLPAGPNQPERGAPSHLPAGLCRQPRRVHPPRSGLQQEREQRGRPTRTGERGGSHRRHHPGAGPRSPRRSHGTEVKRAAPRLQPAPCSVRFMIRMGMFRMGKVKCIGSWVCFSYAAFGKRQILTAPRERE